MPKMVENLVIEVLETHPWQKNIPDIKGKDWEEFFEDIKANGVQHPITISTRTGGYVIVDGHQRVKAAKEIGLTEVETIIKPFEDELAEAMFMVRSNKRRQLTDAEKSDLADMLRIELEKAAAKRVGGRPKKPRPNLVPVFEEEESVSEKEKRSQERKSATIAAKENDLSKEQYRKIRVIKESGLQIVEDFWRAGELSTHAAYQLVIDVKDDRELFEKLSSGEMTPFEAIKILEWSREADEILKAAEKEIEAQTRKFEEEQLKRQLEQEVEAEMVSDIDDVEQETFENISLENQEDLSVDNVETVDLNDIIKGLEQETWDLYQTLQTERDEWLEKEMQYAGELKKLRDQIVQKDKQIWLLEQQLREKDK